MNKRKFKDAEELMMKAEKLRRRMEHAPPELLEKMEEEFDELYGQASRAVKAAAAAEEDEE